MFVRVSLCVQVSKVKSKCKRTLAVVQTNMMSSLGCHYRNETRTKVRAAPRQILSLNAKAEVTVVQKRLDPTQLFN
jgi:hypothetical protein